MASLADLVVKGAKNSAQGKAIIGGLRALSSLVGCSGNSMSPEEAEEQEYEGGWIEGDQYCYESTSGESYPVKIAESAKPSYLAVDVILPDGRKVNVSTDRLRNASVCRGK